LFSETEGGVPKVYVAKVNGTGLRQVAWTGTMVGYAAPMPGNKGFYMGGSEKELTRITTWKVSADGSTVEKLTTEDCGAVWDASPDGKYLLSSLNAGAQTEVGVSEYSISDQKCTSLVPGLNTLVVHFAADGKAILYLVPSRGETTIYRQPWHDGKLAGPAQPAVKLAFAFRQGLSGNAYDFSKDLSTIVYARPSGQADLYYLSAH